MLFWISCSPEIQLCINCSYRMEHVAEINIKINKLNISLRSNDFIPKGINCAIYIHRQAMKYLCNDMHTDEIISFICEDYPNF